MTLKRRIENLERLLLPKDEGDSEGIDALIKELHGFQVAGMRRMSLVNETVIRLSIEIRDHPQATEEQRGYCQAKIDQQWPNWRRRLDWERQNESRVYTDDEHWGPYYPYETGWPWEKLRYGTVDSSPQCDCHFLTP
jgi:hypothetical protein